MPKGAGTRTQIIDTAIDLYASKGFAETSLREIASRVGIKVSSIYNHFSSKEAILEAILDEYKDYIEEVSPANDNLDELLERFDIANRELTVPLLHDMLFFNYPRELFPRYSKMLIIISNESLNNELIRNYLEYDTIESSVVFIRTLFDRLVADGKLAPFDTSTVACLLYSIVITYMNLNIFGEHYLDRHGGNITLWSLADFVLSIVVEGNA